MGAAQGGCALRGRRAKAASQKWKATVGATAALEQKQEDTRGAAAVLEQMSSGHAAHALEQNGASAFSAATPQFH